MQGLNHPVSGLGSCRCDGCCRTMGRPVVGQPQIRA